MVLNDKLKTAMIEDLKQVDILMIDFYARRNQDTLTFLYNQGIIDNSSIEYALEVAVFNQARQDYDRIIAKSKAHTIHADYIGRPDCFAYALDNGKFSSKEIKKIPFDYGYTAETYPKRYGKENLLSVIREEILNPKPLPKFEGDYDPHPVCSCGH